MPNLKTIITKGKMLDRDISMATGEWFERWELKNKVYYVSYGVEE